MSTLLEIEAAAQSLPPDQKKELIRFLQSQLHFGQPRARLVPGPKGTLLLEGPAPMTTGMVKRLMEDFP